MRVAVPTGITLFLSLKIAFDLTISVDPDEMFAKILI